MWRGVIREYWDFLPVKKEECIITLLEGNTPLIPSSRIKKEVTSGMDLFFKYEGLNPTGSFKDRGMTVAVSMAKEMASKAVICASTGNTSASAAAYAAKAGMKAYVLIPEGKSPLVNYLRRWLMVPRSSKLKATSMRPFRSSERFPRQNPSPGHSLNPYRIEGQRQLPSRSLIT